MKLLVGLGNPGAKYARNRHNVGFMAAEAIARGHGFGPWRKRFQAETAEGRLAGEASLILKPATYMNESGRAVAEASRFYKLKAGDVIVFHDELDLAPGKVRVKAGGGHAGHNGLRSIDAHLGPEFQRVRIGIGHPGRKDLVHGYVLHDFAQADRDWLQPLLEAMAAAAPLLVRGDDGRFLNHLNQAVRSADAEAGAPPTSRSPSRFKPPSSVKTPAKAKRSRKAPSQRHLARQAAASGRGVGPRPRAKPATVKPDPAAAEGPLAALLRRWMGGKR